MSKSTKRGIKNVDLGWDELGVNLDDMFARSASPNGSVSRSSSSTSHRTTSFASRSRATASTYSRASCMPPTRLP